MIAKPIETLSLTLALIFTSGCTVQSSAAERDNQQFRTWTDSTGRYQTEAVLIDCTNGNVHLKKRDGNIASVRIGVLSREDQRYLRKELARRAASGRKRKQGRHGVSGQVVDWPGWRGSNRDGKSPDRRLLKEWPEGGPELLWKVDGIGKGFSSVAVTGGMVYITGDLDDRLVLFAFDLDGKPQWETNIDAAWTKSHPGARSTPVIDGGNLYLVSGNGVVGCYDARTGRKKWTRNMRDFRGGVPGWGYAESVLIYNNLAVVTPGRENCIVALNKTSGKTVWTSHGFKAAAQYSSCYAITYKGVSMIVNGTREGIVCVDPNNGRMLWSNPFSAHNTANCPTPIFSDGYVFWANGYGKGGICLKLTVNRGKVSAEEAWRTKEMVCHHGGYIVHEGYIYGNHGGSWVCLDLKNGQKQWEERGVRKGSLCFADGMLYLFSERGGQAGLATCSPKGLEMKGTFNVEGEGPSWAYPVVIGGRLYLRYDTNLYCFNVRAEP
ncbi:MAG: PQQ-binding-like beta-propeller repeat protein [Planctomycetota bacterium]|nr:PQQ-binding-like beta-propeller repeat protein [Planctomycetota bacterium]